MRNIKVNVSEFLLDCLIADDDVPTATSLKEMVYALATTKRWDDQPEGVLDGLVRAYTAQATHDAEQESDDGEPNFELVSGNEAEAIYCKFIVAGYRAVLKGRKDWNHKETDESIRESCDWYEPIVGHWPDQLLAEVAYAKGRRTAREAIAMSEYFRAHAEKIS